MNGKYIKNDLAFDKLEFIEIKDKEIASLRFTMNDRFLRTQKLMRVGLKDVRDAIVDSENRTTQKIEDLRVEMNSKFEDVYSKIDEVKTEMNSKFEDVYSKIDEVKTEMNSKFEDVYSKIDEVKVEVSELNKRVTKIESDTGEIKSILLGMAHMFKEKFKE